MDYVARALHRAAASVDAAVVQAARAILRRDESLFTRSLRADAASGPSNAPLSGASTPIRVRRAEPIEGGRIVDIAWTSTFEPSDAALSARWSSFPANHTARARAFLHEGPARPAIVCLHGYRMGQPSLDAWAFDAAGLFDAGLDVALLTLPFHAARATPAQRVLPPWPSADLPFTREAIRQAEHDTRTLMSWLTQRGAPSIGIAGISLGGFVASLLCTRDAPPDFATLYTPLADLGALLSSHASTAIEPATLEAANKVLGDASPLRRRPTIDGARVLVLAADADGITKSVDHADRLTHHFGARSIRFGGGHFFQYGRSAALAAMQAHAIACSRARPALGIASAA